MALVPQRDEKLSIRARELVIETFCKDLLKYDFMMMIHVWCLSIPFENLYLSNNIVEIMKIFLFNPFVLEVNNKSFFLFDRSLTHFEVCFTSGITEETVKIFNNLRRNKVFFFRSMKETIDNDYLMDFNFNYIINKTIDRLKLIYMLLYILMDYKTEIKTKKITKNRIAVLTIINISLNNFISSL